MLSAALADPRAASAPVEWAQRILAETAVAWLERPQLERPAGHPARPAAGLAAHPGRSSGPWSAGWGRPWLRLQPAATLAADVPQGPAEGERRLATVTAADLAAGLPASYLDRVEQTRSELDSFRRAVGNDIQPAAAATSTGTCWSPSRATGARPRPGRGAAASSGRSGTASGRVYRRIEVGTTPVTLTARRGTIPITVANDSEERVTVVLRLTSPKVDLPAASDPFVLEPGRRTTQLLQVGTRATGTFPIQVDVLTPDGEVRSPAARSG